MDTAHSLYDYLGENSAEAVSKNSQSASVHQTIVSLLPSHLRPPVFKQPFQHHRPSSEDQSSGPQLGSVKSEGHLPQSEATSETSGLIVDPHSTRNSFKFRLVVSPPSAK